MKIKEFKPITEKTAEVDAVETAIIELFRREIYLPLIESLGLKTRTLQNSLEDLLQAIASGQIQYVNGHFEGSFNATLSKELRKIGVWDRKHGWWKVPLSRLTPDMSAAIGVSASRFERMAASVQKKLEEVVPEEVAQKLNLEKIYDATAYRVDKEFEQNVKNITVAPKLTPEQRMRIAKEYTQNMHLYIKDWTDNEITALRKKVAARSLGGIRREGLVQLIQESYDVSLNKAKFLARQETNLLVTKVTQTRYESAGVKRYRWRCVAGSPNHPVRPMHKKLDGQVFSWDNPPVVSENGERKNPGQDYNCRCQAIPFVEF